jgi:ABC-type transporter Mla subunit MlaD
MSVQENAQQLISAANEFGQSATGTMARTSEDLNNARQTLAQMRELVTESMSRAHSLLGSGHGGVGSIGGTANAVAGNIDVVEGGIQQAMGALDALSQAITSHADTMNAVGQQLLQGGS